MRAGVGSEPWSQLLWTPALPTHPRPRPDIPSSHDFLFSVLHDAPEVTKSRPEEGRGQGESEALWGCSVVC